MQEPKNINDNNSINIYNKINCHIASYWSLNMVFTEACRWSVNELKY